MIEFNLRVDSRITRAVAPVILQAFEHSREGVTLEYPLEGEDDQDLLSSWQNDLREDCKSDRASFEAMLQNHKFPHGYIEVAHEHGPEIFLLVKSPHPRKPTTLPTLFWRKSRRG